MSPSWSQALVLGRRIGILLVFGVILFRPTFGEARVPTLVNDVDVLVVLDRTRSMAALDHPGERAGEVPRIVGAQQDLAALASTLPGARLGVLVFGADARVVLPFTSDATAFESAVETVLLERPRDGNGSRADRPVDEVAAVLERSKDAHPERRRIVVYVGDGEDTTSEGEDRDFADLTGLIDGGVVLGYGTPDGARMPASDDLSMGNGYVRDDAGIDAVSRADPDNLEQIADELQVPLEMRSLVGAGTDIATSFEAAYLDSEDDADARQTMTWLLGLVLLALVLAELHAGWHAVWTSSQALSPARARRDRP